MATDAVVCKPPVAILKLGIRQRPSGYQLKGASVLVLVRGHHLSLTCLRIDVLPDR